ncbi:hypothetical protein H0H87_001185 [Tephrocybe sp. NHM501043]|nr:hypothetical protein H0H87_001185 [Tephrocybe sp. NHM501043]
MSATPREIGTLIVVVLKANHLPNKRHIGKQDPYCLVTHNGEKRRTKAIKRGGQHPEWDEEIRFTLYEDVGSSVSGANGTPPPPPPKEIKGPKKVKGGWTMKIACFADDAREPDLIGEADVDLTEVLTKGETDGECSMVEQSSSGAQRQSEWFTLMNKDKFSGKVYLELTFWSNEPAPEKKVTPKPAKSKQYGGPGSFVPSGGEPESGLPNGASHHPSRIVSGGNQYDHSRQDSDSIPSSLRASSSLAKLDLYVPPYERSVDIIANEFGDLGVSDHRRRESFPPPQRNHPTRQPSPGVYSSLSSSHSHRYGQSLSDASYDKSPHHAQASGAQIQAPYQPQYETQASYHPPARGPRHSIPTSSSGFMPLPNPPAFTPLSSHSSEPSLFGGPPAVYNAPPFNSQPMYSPQTPVPDPYLIPSTSSTFVPQQSFPQSQSFQYMQFPPSTTPAPQAYSTALAQVPLVQPAPPQAYQAYTPTPSPSHDASNPSTLPHSSSATSSFGSGSRPLPLQPQVVYTQPQAPVVYSAPPSNTPQLPLNSFTPSQSGTSIYPTNGVYQTPPPPPPPVQYTVGQSQPSIIPPPPPPPPPSSNASNHTTRRQSSLPQPPMIYQQAPQSSYQPPPPPPPLPSTEFSNLSLPPPPPPPHISGQNLSYHPGPLPTPPAILDGQTQWSSQATYN